MHQSGYIKAVRPDKGFGFITNVDDEDVFFHSSALPSGMELSERLIELAVTFTQIQAERGPKAIDVRPVDY